MKFLLDCGDLEQIRHWLGTGVIDGVTTNPTILRDGAGEDLAHFATELAKVCEGRPVFVEVIAEEPAEVAEQARVIGGLAPNIVVKIPLVGPSGQDYLGVISRLSAERVAVNCTALLSFGQVALAARAGAAYVSVFVGRIEDEGGSGARLIEDCRRWLDLWELPVQIVAASLRSAGDFQRAALAGAHAVTVPPAILRKLGDHHYSRATARQFLTDGRARFGDSPWPPATGTH